MPSGKFAENRLFFHSHLPDGTRIWHIVYLFLAEVCDPLSAFISCYSSSAKSVS